MICKFCHIKEGSEVDFYMCDECLSFMCHDCTYTSIKTGRDFCKYCVYNLKYIGRVV